MINNGNNFYIIKNDVVQFWGLNIDNPFEININNTITDFINEKGYHLNGVCEFNEDKDIELYRICLLHADNKTFNEERILLMNQLKLLGINKEDARIIAIDAGSSQTVVNSSYLNEFGFNKQLQEKIINIICKFYISDF